MSTGSIRAAVAEPTRASAAGVRQLSSTALGRPVVAGRMVFWREPLGRRIAIHGYDLRANAPLSIAVRDGAVVGMAADDTRVAWVERGAAGQLGVFGADRGTHAVSLILGFAGHPAPSEIALDHGVLYYTDSTPGHAGLFARDLTSGAEQLISPAGQRPLAHGGALLWSEARTTGARGRWIWSLHMRAADGSRAVLAEREAGYGGFGGYDTDGGTIVWAFEPSSGDARVYAHQIGAGTTNAVASSAGAAPRVHGRRIMWAEASAGPGWPARWLVRVYGLDVGALPPIVAESSAALAVAGIDGDSIVLAVVDDPAQGAQSLYIGDIRARGLRFAARPAMAVVPAACDYAQPASCGQVHAAGALLADDDGAWRMLGVQFFLPQFGINDKTFRTGNYAGALADGSLNFWLDKAQRYLRANTLRIFVDLPYRLDGELITPTDHATLFDFATRADARGMRLGISLHNSADWTMSAERAGWISGLIDYFAARGRLPAIAYLSADNEINNHCGRDGADCFDSDAQHDAHAYVDGAVGWVARFRTVVKGRAPQLLVTVGVSTEMADVDQTRGVFNFFRADSQGHTLASLVDFLSPHNYGGGATGIVEDMRFVGYSGPVVLEEFGYPSDPYPRSPTWTEGAPVCRIDPAQPQCALTAPFFVEQNIQALRTRSYAGAAAWMIADMREKDSGSACTNPDKPFDLWTGLFAIGGTYCDGGTYSRTLGQPKATAVRVCAYYADDLALCEPGVPPKRRLYLPIMARG
ncbi:MAG: hypothetical protein ACJ8CR_15640 [Roseiflexaceae bacterium]